MSIWDYLKDRLFGRTEDKPAEISIKNVDGWVESFQTVQVQKLAFMAGVRLIASSISQCEVRTFRKHEETDGLDWYALNVSPNLNTNSSVFWYDLIRQLYIKGEALVVDLGTGFLVASDFVHTVQAFNEDIFSSVTVRGLALKKSFRMSEVLYFKLHDENIRLRL